MSRKNSLALRAIKIAIYSIIFCACLALFYKQAVGEYISDLTAHLSVALDPDTLSYSLSALLLLAAHRIGGLWGVAVLLSLVEIGTIIAAEAIIKQAVPKAKSWVCFIGAIACCFATALYIPIENPNMYLGISTGSIWHNSTFQFMKLTALLAVFIYMKLTGNDSASIRSWEWPLFALTLIISTLMKPSFFVIFAPAVFIIEVVFLVQNGKRAVKRFLFICACLALPVIALLFQYLILFGSSDSQSSIALGFGTVFFANVSRPKLYFVFYVLRSFAFPIAVLVIGFRHLKNDKLYAISWIMLLLAFAEVFFIYETGPRMYHGNFGWSAQFAAFFVFLTSFITLINAIMERANVIPRAIADAPDQPARTPDWRFKAYSRLCILLLLFHFGTGIVYFIRVLSGFIYY